MLQINFFLTFESFYTIFVAAFVYNELVRQLEATNRLIKLNISENREVDAILDFLFTFGHHES